MGEDYASEVGMTLGEMMDGAFNGNVKSLFIMAENPMLSDPNLNHVKEALREFRASCGAGYFHDRNRKACSCNITRSKFY